MKTSYKTLSCRTTGALMVVGLILMSACKDKTVQRNEITLWSSNNPEEMDFINHYAKEWNISRPDAKVLTQPIPEGQSSEEVILAAVVARTTPDIYANMWQGEVEDYARAGVLVPLDTIPGFLEFMQARCAPQVLQEITSQDGHIYQVPWKVNPIITLYNSGMFRHGGVDEIPDTYQDFLKAGPLVTRDTNNDGYYDIWLGSTEISPIWWQRLFNFVPLYYAASGGAPLVRNGQAAFDNAYGIQVFSFLQELYSKGYFPKEQMKGQSDPFLAQKIAVRFAGPWSIKQINAFRADDLEYGFHPLPVPAGHSGPVYTYCDPKNIVMFSTCQKPREAWEFIRSLITPEGDLRFLEMSNQMPRRSDLLTNPAFMEYFEQHPRMMPFARQSPYLRGIDSNTNMKEVLDLISQEYEACVVFGKKSPEEAIRDAAEAVNLLYLK